MSPRPPPVRRGIGPCLLAFFPWRVGLLCSLFVFFLFCVSTTRRPSLPLARRSVLCPPPPRPLAVSSLPSPLSWVCGGEGGGGGGRPRCPSSGVSTSQARRRHEARHLSLCKGRGGGLAVWLPSLPFLPCVRTPGAPPAGACTVRASYGHSHVVRPAPSLRCLPTLPLCPRGGGGGRCPPLPTFIPHPWGGGGVWGGGGGRPCRLPFVARTSQARRKHAASTRRGTCPSAGGGGACRVSPVVAPPTLRAPPRGGGGVWGGGGALVVVPSVHACRRHDASTTQALGEALGCSGGGGVSPLGLPALLHGIGSAPRDLQPLLPLGGSRHVSAGCSVSRACSLLCPYLLEEVHTRVETDDEEVRAAGRTYRTPRRLLAPSAALVEGRASVSAPNSPGGADCPSSPRCLCIHFRAA